MKPVPCPRTHYRPNLCSLLDWPDLGYPGTEGGGGPTKTGVVPDSVVSCEWASQQFNAGYTPSPEPGCNAESGDDVGGALSCVGDDAQRLAEIYDNSAFVIITVAYRAGRTKPARSRSRTAMRRRRSGRHAMR